MEDLLGSTAAGSSETDGGQDDGRVKTETVESDLNRELDMRFTKIEKIKIRTSRANQDQAVPNRTFPLLH